MKSSIILHEIVQIVGDCVLSATGDWFTPDDLVNIPKDVIVVGTYFFEIYRHGGGKTRICIMLPTGNWWESSDYTAPVLCKGEKLCQ